MQKEPPKFKDITLGAEHHEMVRRMARADRRTMRTTLEIIIDAEYRRRTEGDTHATTR